MRKSGSVRKTVCWRRKRDLGAFPRRQSKSEGNEENWFRRKRLRLAADVTFSTPKRTEGNEEKWFRKTNVPESLLVAELIDISKGREMAVSFQRARN
jgi:hypothetical protein